ncbi:hypothetical protein Adt_19860 [Abeliophyllum distichum]|uniref:Uncharacterized protein n=1 Tax=Abeliophyllum distichum TaxID=126358 RepID=A0ABD1SV83_9LAMI
MARRDNRSVRLRHERAHWRADLAGSALMSRRSGSARYARVQITGALDLAHQICAIVQITGEPDLAHQICAIVQISGALPAQKIRCPGSGAPDLRDGRSPTRNGRSVRSQISSPPKLCLQISGTPDLLPDLARRICSSLRQ